MNYYHCKLRKLLSKSNASQNKLPNLPIYPKHGLYAGPTTVYYIKPTLNIFLKPMYYSKSNPRYFWKAIYAF